MSEEEPTQNEDIAYIQCIDAVFREKWKAGLREIRYTLADVRRIDRDLDLAIENHPDVTYSFRSGRLELPESVKALAPENHVWVIRGEGKSKYNAVAISRDEAYFDADRGVLPIKVPDATPGIIARYAKTDEQSLLARIRYNRLIDIYSGVACYSLQNHYRTSVRGWGQLEVDELYVGIDRAGAHYLFPIEAKSLGQKLGIVQVEQGFSVGREKFPSLECRPIAAQIIENGVIALYELVNQNGRIWKSRERHYLLVPQETLTEAELSAYRTTSRSEGP